MAKRKTKEIKRYKVLIPCGNDDTKKRYEQGEEITSEDFPAYVIKQWITAVPPVLEEVD